MSTSENSSPKAPAARARGATFRFDELEGGGYLYKRARNSGVNWKRRFFTFDEKTQTLRYFEHAPALDSDEEPLGTLQLSDETSVVTSGIRENALEIHPGNLESKPLYVRSPDVSKLLLWKIRLNKYIHPCKAGYLEKRARISGRNWRTRYINLDMTTGHMRIHDKIGNAPIRVFRFAKGFEAHTSGLRDHCIEVQSTDRSEPSLFLAAKSATEQVEWLTALKQVCALSAEAKESDEGATPRAAGTRAGTGVGGRDNAVCTAPSTTFQKFSPTSSASLEAAGRGRGHHRDHTYTFRKDKEVLVVRGGRIVGLGCIVSGAKTDKEFGVLMRDSGKVKRVSKDDLFHHRVCDFEFTLGKKLGKGAFATVYSGLNHADGSLIAIKKMKLKFGKKLRETLTAIMDEVRLLKELDHPNIVRFLGSELSLRDHHMYIMMEQVSGGSLAAALRSFGEFKDAVIVSYTRQIVTGLGYLHTSGVIHRDLKCANVLLGTAGIVKLADFGVSKRIKDTLTSGSGGGKNDQKLVQEVVGSPYWMAPEVVLDEGHDTSCDIWSLGCTMIEMATACHPWKDYDSPMSCCFAIGQSEKLPFYPTDLPQDLTELIIACLQRDRRKRPTCAELLQFDAFTQRMLSTGALARTDDGKAVSGEAATSQPHKGSVPNLRGNHELSKSAADIRPDDDSVRGTRVSSRSVQ